MHSPEEKDFNQFYEDWRHRDRLTWQIPSVVVVIGGAIIIGAYASGLCWQIRALVFVLGQFFATTMTVMLAQNLYYQWRDQMYVEHFDEVKVRRASPLPPKVTKDKVTKEGKESWEETERDCLNIKLGRIIERQRMGSTLLLVLCVCFSIVLGMLFGRECFWRRYHLIGIVIPLIIFAGPMAWFKIWLKAVTKDGNSQAESQRSI